MYWYGTVWPCYSFPGVFHIWMSLCEITWSINLAWLANATLRCQLGGDLFVIHCWSWHAVYCDFSCLKLTAHKLSKACPQPACSDITNSRVVTCDDDQVGTVAVQNDLSVDCSLFLWISSIYLNVNDYTVNCLYIIREYWLSKNTASSLWFTNVNVTLAQVLLVTCLKEQMPTTLSMWLQGGIARLSCCWGESWSLGQPNPFHKGL